MLMAVRSGHLCPKKPNQTILWNDLSCFYYVCFRTHEGVWVREHFSRTPPMSVNSLALFVSDFPQPISNNYLQTGIVVYH